MMFACGQLAVDIQTCWLLSHSGVSTVRIVKKYVTAVPTRIDR